jgi:hypothetical protein
MPGTLPFLSENLFAHFFAAYERVDSRYSNEEVDYRFNCRPRTEKHVYHVPVSTTSEHRETNKSPVDSSYHYEDPSNHRKTIHKERKKNITSSILALNDGYKVFLFVATFDGYGILLFQTNSQKILFLAFLC